MNKFDHEGNALLMAIVDAESRHPKPGDGDTQRFSLWNLPLVKVNSMYGRAVGYTHSYGLISWQGEDGRDHLEWFAADLISRVSKEDWHGR